jgi:eukaryotic-like serine/threonine-protein kinase
LSTCGLSWFYLARDSASGSDVVITAIGYDADDHSHAVSTYLRNWAAVQQMRHPNIVSVYHIGEGDGFVWMAMQHASGGLLSQLLRESPTLPVSDAVVCAVQIAYALQYLHEQGIMHCGVTPSAILLEHAGGNHVLLSDFDLARIQSVHGSTLAGMVIGTPSYMSSECAEARELDGRSDIYALGCVLYAMLAGRPPFVGATPVSVRNQHVHSRPADVRNLNPIVPAGLAQTVETALAKRPDKRYDSAETFARALLPFAGTLPDLAH